MTNIGDLVGRGFERLVRWAYPGLLFGTLLALGHGDILDKWKNVPHSLFSGIVVLLVAGFVIYVLHRHILNELEIVILHCLRMSAFSCNPRPIPYVDQLAQSNQRRFGYKDDTYIRDVERFSRYLTDQWAVVHAMGLTFWLLLVMYAVAADGSALRQNLPPWGMWVLVGLFFVGHGFGTVLLQRVELQYFQQALDKRTKHRWLGP